jgi:hypothetical protein
MKKMIGVLALVVGLVSAAMAWDQVNTSVDGLNVKGGTLAIDAVKITATAAELNKTDGLTATPAQLNAAATLAGDGTVAATALTGNIAQAAMTNALITAGSKIGGDIPVAALTNALAGTAYTTNTLTGDGVTNVFIFRTVGTGKIIHSITTTP